MNDISVNRSICAVIPTKDNMRTIQECLESILPVTTDIIVIDSGSTDGTVALCEKYGAKVLHRPWLGMVKQRQFCLDQASAYDWILNLDSDEALDQELQKSIIALKERTVDPVIEGFTFNRKVWFLGGWLHHVFQPEHRLRIVRGGTAIVKGIGPEGMGGHDRLLVNGRVEHLQGVCKHDSWKDLDEMLLSYIRLGRRAAIYDPKPSKPYMIFLNPLVAFIKQYVFKKGYKDGCRGLIASAGVACGTMIKQIQKNERRGLFGKIDNS